jgi:hypothetical protein
MHRHHIRTALTVWAILCILGLLGPDKVSAHCDGLDGPVVKAAQKALETGDVHRVLIWVQKQDETDLKEAFQKTLAVRQLSPEARELADRYFFETLVRLHRAGEGAAYTGLKPAGRDLGPAIPAADKAIEDASAAALLHLLTATLHEGLLDQFTHVMATKAFGTEDVEGGRAYVQAYVAFIHYVERSYETLKHPAHGHFPEHEEARVHKEAQ